LRPWRDHNSGAWDLEVLWCLGFGVWDFGTPCLDRAFFQDDNQGVPFWGRTGFDHEDAPEAACRGWFVGLVKNRTKKIKANEELALAA
jgi:hypothetical protein